MHGVRWSRCPTTLTPTLAELNKISSACLCRALSLILILILIPVATSRFLFPGEQEHEPGPRCMHRESGGPCTGGRELMLCFMSCSSSASGLHSSCEMEPSLVRRGWKSPRKWAWTRSANAWSPDSDEKVPALVHVNDSFKFSKWLSDAACARPFRVRAPSLLHDVGTFQARRRAGPEDFAAAKGCSPPRATGSPKSCHHASPTIEQEHGQQRRRRHPSGAPTPARPGHAPSPRAWPPACPRHIPQSEEQNQGQQAREERQQKPKQAEEQNHGQQAIQQKPKQGERSRSVESQ